MQRCQCLSTSVHSWIEHYVCLLRALQLSLVSVAHGQPLVDHKWVQDLGCSISIMHGLCVWAVYQMPNKMRQGVFTEDDNRWREVLFTFGSVGMMLRTALRQQTMQGRHNMERRKAMKQNMMSHGQAEAAMHWTGLQDVVE